MNTAKNMTYPRSTKYEIFTGFKKDGNLEAKLPAGAAFLDEGLNYYKIRLMIFPQTTYYLVKNKDAQDRYTVYSKLINEGQNTKFLNPVGGGILDRNLQSYLELKFPVLRAHLFMSLFESRK
jgi:hypothetical protein